MAGVELHTPRLLVRTFRRSDIDRMLPLISAKEIAATTLRIPHPYTRDDAEQFLTYVEQEGGKGLAHRFAIVEKSSNDYCGNVGLHIEPEHSRAELGYWIGLPYWGRGYATEAAQAVVAYGFRELRLNRIFATVFAGNAASRRVAQKAGLRYEGLMHQHVKKWGKYVDVEIYGALSSDLLPWNQ